MSPWLIKKIENIRPYAIWYYKVPNQHLDDPEAPKPRPILIIYPGYRSYEDIKDGMNLDRPIIYEMCTSHVDKYVDNPKEPKNFLIDGSDISLAGLTKPSIIRFGHNGNPVITLKDLVTRGRFVQIVKNPLLDELYNYINTQVYGNTRRYKIINPSKAETLYSYKEPVDNIEDKKLCAVESIDEFYSVTKALKELREIDESLDENIFSNNAAEENNYLEEDL